MDISVCNCSCLVFDDKVFDVTNVDILHEVVLLLSLMLMHGKKRRRESANEMNMEITLMVMLIEYAIGMKLNENFGDGICTERAMKHKSVTMHTVVHRLSRMNTEANLFCFFPFFLALMCL